MRRLAEEIQARGLLVGPFELDLNMGPISVSGEPAHVLEVIMIARSLEQSDDYGEHNQILSLSVSYSDLEAFMDTQDGKRTPRKEYLWWGREFKRDGITIKEWLELMGHPYK